jgi:P22 coat protein - gene protein 5
VAANDFQTPEVIARMALGILQREIVLPKLVNRQAEAEFQPGMGGVINIRKPGTLTGGGARTYTQALRDAGTEIVFDNAEDTVVPIAIDVHLYKGIKVTDDDFLLNLRDFGTQILVPQVRVLVEGLEEAVATELGTLGDDLEIAADGSDLHDQLIAARAILNSQFVPLRGRVLVISPEIETMLLLDAQDKIMRFDSTGQPGTPALREATIGRLYGFDIVISPALGAGTAVAMNRDAVSLVVAAPPVPEGVTFGRSIAAEGLALRYIRDYDARFTQDRSLVSTFYGTDTLDANRAVRLITAA